MLTNLLTNLLTLIVVLYCLLFILWIKRQRSASNSINQKAHFFKILSLFIIGLSVLQWLSVHHLVIELTPLLNIENPPLLLAIALSYAMIQLIRSYRLIITIFWLSIFNVFALIELNVLPILIGEILAMFSFLPLSKKRKFLR